MIAEEDVRTLETEAMISDKLKFEEELVRAMNSLVKLLLHPAVHTRSSTCTQHTAFKLQAALVQNELCMDMGRAGD